MISGGWDMKLLVWDLDSYASFTELEGHTGRINGYFSTFVVCVALGHTVQLHVLVQFVITRPTEPLTMI